MAKFNRPLDDQQLDITLEKTIQHVLERVPAYPVKKPFFSRFRLVSLGFALTATVVVSFVGLNALNSPTSSSVIIQSSSSITSGVPATVTLSTQATQTVASLAYVSAGLLSFEHQLAQLSSNTLSTVSTKRLARTQNLTTTSSPQLTDQLDLVSVYFERFQPYLDNGEDLVADPTLLTSDRPDYGSMSIFSVDNETYSLYLNEGSSEEEVTGLLVIGIEEFTIQGEIEFEDDDEIEMKLVASNSEATMVIEYTKEQGVGEQEITYLIETTRGEVVTTREVKLEHDQEEAIVVMVIPEGELEFKRELDDGINVYSVVYTLNNISGEAIIEVAATDYRFIITEGDDVEEHHVTPPEFDDDDEDDNEDDDEIEEDD